MATPASSLGRRRGKERPRPGIRNDGDHARPNRPVSPVLASLLSLEDLVPSRTDQEVTSPWITYGLARAKACMMSRPSPGCHGGDPGSGTGAAFAGGPVGRDTVRTTGMSATVFAMPLLRVWEGMGPNAGTRAVFESRAGCSRCPRNLSQRSTMTPGGSIHQELVTLAVRTCPTDLSAPGVEERPSGRNRDAEHLIDGSSTSARRAEFQHSAKDSSG